MTASERDLLFDFFLLSLSLCLFVHQNCPLPIRVLFKHMKSAIFLSLSRPRAINDMSLRDSSCSYMHTFLSF